MRVLRVRFLPCGSPAGAQSFRLLFTQRKNDALKASCSGVFFFSLFFSVSTARERESGVKNDYIPLHNMCQSIIDRLNSDVYTVRRHERN